MSFRANDCQQLSFFDSFSGLTAREQKALENSWAKVFADEIFPEIDEQRFSVLYSDKASRPNTPVNVIIGALIIKELFDLSDDEIVENLMLDPRYQYALHTTSFTEQPLSDKTLSRFRKRCYDYESTYNVDLYHDCITDLGSKIAKMMKLNSRIRRMDSMMIESNIRRLSRMELLYTCVAKLVSYLHKEGKDNLLEGLEHYYDPNDFNRVIYHSRNEDASKKISDILKDADLLLDRCGGSYDEVTEYQLLVRCLSEQTVVKEAKRRLKTKEDGDMDSRILQNPSDPDATYRDKAGKKHRGYAANLEETVGENGSVVTDYQYDQNIQSDSQFMKEYLSSQEPQEEKITVITDGAYSGEENRKLAEEKNIDLVTTDLSGRKVPDIYADFEFNEQGTRITRCPAGHMPKSSSFMGPTRQCRASFDRSLCASCPNKDKCRAKIHKKTAVVVISKGASERARQQRRMQTEEFRQLARIRNGVETLPSILRNQYHVDNMFVRGLQKTKFFFGSKIGALNFRKLFRYRKGLGHYAQNPAIT